MIAIRERALSKLPEVTLGFWIIKILATTLGETGGVTHPTGARLTRKRGSAIDKAARLEKQSFAPLKNRKRTRPPGATDLSKG